MKHLTRWLRALSLVVLSLGTLSARAALPAEYHAMVVEPQAQDQQMTFDLRPAQAQARKMGKNLYVYLGARDCPYCRRYEAFLAQHTKELVPAFEAKYLVVELRSALEFTAQRLMLRSEQHHLPYAEFQKAIGDQRARLLVYPSVWVLSPEAKPLMQMPAGAGTFQTVPEQLEILDLVE